MQAIAVYPLEKKLSAGKILEIPEYRQISHQVTLDAGSDMISGKFPRSTKFERLFPFRLRKRKQARNVMSVIIVSFVTHFKSSLSAEVLLRPKLSSLEASRDNSAPMKSHLPLAINFRQT